jgi:protein O-GlcNAc transferase
MFPAKAQALLQEALTHHQAGRFAAALSGYSQVRKHAPGNYDAHHLSGVALLQSGKPVEAIPWLRRALQLRATAAPSAMCLGLALAQTGQPVEAETQLRKATQFDPQNHEALTNLASVLVVLGKLEEARTAYQRCVELRPDYAIAWSGLGSVLDLLGRPAEAIPHHTQALKLDPTHAKARFSRAQSWQSLHCVDEAQADFEAHLKRFPGDLEAQSYRLFLLNYSAEMSREALFSEHLAFGRAAEKAAAGESSSRPASAPRAGASAPKKLRVAFLSPDLRAHSVAYFLEPLLRHLDRDRFEIVLYHDHFSVDETSVRLKTAAALWRNFVGQTPEQVENQIRRDAPDILIDLAGHTGSNRLPLFARRLAPVQISYLGYPNTTGLTAMDYRFSDPIADPPGDSESVHTERLARFSPCAWTYLPPASAPHPTSPLSAGGQPFTFGSFNSLSKINAATLTLWARILRAVPTSRLLLKSLGLRADDISPRLAAAGINADRVVLLSAAPRVDDHLAAYKRMDVALDPFPYQGTTTTCEALWMGVPVISLRGDRHASRVGASLLTAAGHPEWIADSPEAYVALAVQFTQPAYPLVELRTRLRSEVQHSILFDHRAQAERFGSTLLECWQQRTGPRPATAVVPARA